ncbi:MAG: class I SAM-dependent methyltransferase [Bacteroidota bacterium]
MASVSPELFTVLHDPQAEKVLTKLYRATLKQQWSVSLHLLPKVFKLMGKGVDWKTENAAFYDDKYIPIHPAQGSFIYLQAVALRAKNILEFGTSYGISTIYLATAARENGGRVITTEYLPQKVEQARKNFVEAGLSEYIDVWEGNALESLKRLDPGVDFVLLDGWPDLVFPVFKLIEPKLKQGAVIIVDDVEGFKPSMQDYLDYVRDRSNGYISTTLYPKKGIEFTVKVG